MIAVAMSAKTEYEMVYEKVSWYEARLGCAERGMELVRVDTREQNDLIQGMINGTTWTAGNILYAKSLGAHPAGYFWWWDEYGNIRPGVYNWGKGEPNNERLQEYCIVMGVSGKWYDVSCVQPYYYLCQK